MIKNISKIVGMTALLSVPMAAMATNGYLLHGYGKNKGMGGAGMAHAQDALSGANNPASSAFTDTRFDMTAEFFFPNRGYKLSNNGLNDGVSFGDAFDLAGAIPGSYGQENSITVKSEKDIFLIPAMGFNWKYSDNLTLAFAMYGAGLGTEYNRNDTEEMLQTLQLVDLTFGEAAKTDGTFGAGSTGIDLVLILTNFHAAYKITDDFAVGGGINIAMQSFKAKGLQAFKPVLAVDENGKRAIIGEKDRSLAYGAGFNLGVQKEIIPGLTMGAAYYSKIGLRHRDYTGLFAGNGDFSLPPRINIGMSIELNKNHRVNIDVQKVLWSTVSSTSNKFTSFFNAKYDLNQAPTLGTVSGNSPIVFLGEEDAAGFGFEDSLVYKFGYEFSLNAMPSYTWRLGYSYQDQIIPSSGTLFPMLAPATIQHHYTAGFTKDFGNDYEFTFNVMYTGKEWLEGTRESKGIDIYLEEYTAEFALGIKW